jgi:hypothetical protein
MAFVKKDRVRERSTTTGTGAFTLAGAPSGYRAFSSVCSVSDTFWYAIVHPGNAWEVGLGTYSGANTLTRTTIYDSSNAGAAVNFTAGSKDVFIGLPARNAAFEPGTNALFQQTSAPVGWTKQTTHNDKALRVVSGAASSGGTNSFSTVMAQTTVGNHTMTIAESASHDHSNGAAFVTTAGLQGGGTFPGAQLLASGNTGLTGGGGSHNHTITMAMQYVDIIIATKD